MPGEPFFIDSAPASAAAWRRATTCADIARRPASAGKHLGARRGQRNRPRPGITETAASARERHRRRQARNRRAWLSMALIASAGDLRQAWNANLQAAATSNHDISRELLAAADPRQRNSWRPSCR